MGTSTLQIGKNIISVGRDFKGNIINNNPKELFSKVNLTGFSKNYVKPTIASSILQRVNNKLILIGGDYDFDKGSLLNYLAEQLHQSTSFDVYEWVGVAERQSFISSLKGLKDGIVIFQKLQPHHLNYDLLLLEKIAQQNQLIFLTSTDIPQNAWQLSSVLQQKYWLQLDSQKISYDAVELKQYLAKKLNKNIKEISFANGLNKVDANSQLPGGSLTQLAKNFSTPEQIDFFVKTLTLQKGNIDINIIMDCLKDTLGKQDTLMYKWFHSLPALEQYVALSMVLFSDLYDDQYFEVAKKLSKEEWQYSHNGLKALDYRDIEKLFSFFKYDIVDREHRLIRNKYPNQQIELFKISWYSHRRHIKMAVDMGIDLVIESSKENYLNSELFGNENRRRMLRKSVTSLLSDLGRVSKTLIQTPLLTLASQDSIASQNVAAEAIAKWKEIPGGEKQLFEFLSNWQETSKWKPIIIELIKGREKVLSHAVYLRATIILTIAKAAKYDTPNKLSIELIELLFSFIDDTNDLVRDRFRQTISDILRLHAVQFTKPLQLGKKTIVPLEEFLKKEDLIYPVAVGLAFAYTENPDVTEKIIASCLKHCANKFSDSKKTKLTDRDKLMAAMVITLGKIIEMNGIHTSINGKLIYDILKRIRLEEKNNIIKRVFVDTIMQLTLVGTKNKKPIKILLPKLSKQERNYIVSVIGAQYMEERKEQYGGDLKIKVDNITYDSWRFMDRPFLKIEQLMFDWLREDSKKLKQLATLAFIEFSVLLEYKEKKKHRWLRIVEKLKAFFEKIREMIMSIVIFRSPLIRGYFSVINLFYRIFIRITISKGTAKILDAVMPIIAKDYLSSRRYKRVVIKKWKRVSGDIKNAAKLLSKF
ncbi:hypothetical protein [Kordia jejudonensis]|uniref:hypothetical protein n=1 Tax=Kordia jejudonensis TaxID=1348245 RepID=UPI000628FB92|nr:hypothetical protein [Kordia jejudonensis]